MEETCLFNSFHFFYSYWNDGTILRELSCRNSWISFFFLVISRGACLETCWLGTMLGATVIYVFILSCYSLYYIYIFLCFVNIYLSTNISTFLLTSTYHPNKVSSYLLTYLPTYQPHYSFAIYLATLITAYSPTYLPDYVYICVCIYIFLLLVFFVDMITPHIIKTIKTRGPTPRPALTA